MALQVQEERLPAQPIPLSAWRASSGANNRRTEALILSPDRQYVVGSRDIKIFSHLFADGSRPILVGFINVGVQKANSDRFDASFFYLFDGLANFCII